MTSLWRRPVEKTRSRATRRDRGLRPSCETVESRVTPTASVSLEFGVVTIRSAPGLQETQAEVSTLADQLNIRVDGTTYRFSASAVSLVTFDAGATTAGSVQTFVNDTATSSFALGGGGLNQFTAGSFCDTFVGVAGTNVFQARDGFAFFIGAFEGTNDFRGGSGSGLFFVPDYNSTVSGITPNYLVARF